MHESVDVQPILIALVINLVLIYLLPRPFSNPTGFKAFDDLVSYLKAQQAFVAFSSFVLAVVMYLTSYYMLHYSEESMSPSTPYREPVHISKE